MRNLFDEIKTMSINLKLQKILWANSAGICSFEDCNEKLCTAGSMVVEPFLIGEIAHICGSKPGSSRYNTQQSDTERDNYQNLILLCPNHHRLIDKKENEKVYTVEILQNMKANHEDRMNYLTTNNTTPTKVELAKEIFEFLEENRQVWKQYGPKSELAYKHPHDERAHKLWLNMRLTVIIPNNRKIKKLLQKHESVFGIEEKKFVKNFLLHTCSYEKWVNDEIHYNAVRRFPTEFDELIRKIIDART